MRPPGLPATIAEAPGFVFDVDGTLIREGAVLPGAQSLLHALVQDGRGVSIASNATWRSSEQLAAFLDSLNLEVTPGATVTVLDLVAETLAAFAGRRVMVLGHPPLIEAVAAADVEIVDGGPVDLVVLGRLPTGGWDRLDSVVHALFEGAAYVATSEDAIAVAGDGTIAAGAGAAVAGLERVTGRRPDRLVGKPAPQMIRRAADRLGLAPESVVVVGDSPSSDIAAGRAAGAATVLVETGVAALERRARGGDTLAPTRAVRSLVELERLIAASERVKQRGARQTFSGR